MRPLFSYFFNVVSAAPLKKKKKKKRERERDNNKLMSIYTFKKKGSLPRIYLKF